MVLMATQRRMKRIQPKRPTISSSGYTLFHIIDWMREAGRQVIHQYLSRRLLRLKHLDGSGHSIIIPYFVEKTSLFSHLSFDPTYSWSSEAHVQPHIEGQNEIVNMNEQRKTRQNAMSNPVEQKIKQHSTKHPSSSGPSPIVPSLF